MIDYIVKANKEAAVLRRRLDDLVQERDDMIREELVRGDEAERRGKASLLAKATAMHVQRIYQIRDNRR